MPQGEWSVTEQYDEDQVTVTPEDEVIRVSIRMPYLPQHIAYQKAVEIEISDRISFADFVSADVIHDKIERSRSIIFEEFIKTVRAIEQNPFIMQRICDSPEMLPETGNNNGSRKKLPKDYHASPTPKLEQTEPLPAPDQAPVSTPPSTPAEVDSKKYPHPVVDLIEKMAEKNVQKQEEKINTNMNALMGEIHAIIMSSEGKKITYASLKERMKGTPKDVLNDAVQDMVDHPDEWGVYDAPVGVLSLMEPAKAKTPEKPQEKPKDEAKAAPVQEGVSVRDQLKKSKKTEKAQPSATPPPKQQDILCSACGKTFPLSDLDVKKDKAGLCPHCGSPKWGDPKSQPPPSFQTKVQNNTIDGKILRLIHDGHAVCPWCLDAGTVKSVTKADIDYTGKWGQKIVMCYDHRGEVKRNDANPATKKTQEGTIATTIEKYKGQWEAI